MPRMILQVCCIAGFLVAGTGCEQQAPSEPSPLASDPAVSVNEPPDAEPAHTPEESPSDDVDEPATVELEIVTFEELQASIAASKGKIVVVDYWSTSCGPCMAEFPDLVAMHHEMPSTQVRCVSASLDYEGLPDFPIEEAQKTSLEFLEEKQATLDNFIVNENSLDVIEYKLKIASIPSVWVYDVDGKVARQFDDSSGEPFTYEKDVTPFVKELVAKRFPAVASAGTE